jgi:excisionase family DNA binding protein
VDEKLLKGSDVANILNICRSFAYQLMREEKLPVVRMGRAVRVKTSDLEMFITRNTSEIDKKQANVPKYSHTEV